MEERNRRSDSLVNQLEKPIPISGSTSSRLSLVVQQELFTKDPCIGYIGHPFAKEGPWSFLTTLFLLVR